MLYRLIILDINLVNIVEENGMKSFKAKNAKKSVRPISVLRFIGLSVWVVFIGLSIAAPVLILIENKFGVIDYVAIALSLPLLILNTIVLILDFRKRVVFDAESLTVPEDFSDKKSLIIRRFQYNVNVKYEQIKNLYISFSKNDSNDKPVKNVFVYMPYIVMDCMDGTRKAINVYYYNRRQKIGLIDEIKFRAEKVGNALSCATGMEMWKHAYESVTKF